MEKLIMASLAIIRTVFEYAISEILHYQAIRRLKKAAHPCAPGSANKSAFP